MDFDELKSSFDDGEAKISDMINNVSTEVISDEIDAIKNGEFLDSIKDLEKSYIDPRYSSADNTLKNVRNFVIGISVFALIILIINMVADASNPPTPPARHLLEQGRFFTNTFQNFRYYGIGWPWYLLKLLFYQLISESAWTLVYFICLVVSVIICIIIIFTPRPNISEIVNNSANVNYNRYLKYHYHMVIPKDKLSSDFNIVKTDIDIASDKDITDIQDSNYYDFIIKYTSDNKSIKFIINTYNDNIKEYRSQVFNYTSNDILINDFEDLKIDFILDTKKLFIIINDVIKESDELNYYVKNAYNHLKFYSNDSGLIFSDFKIKLYFKIRYDMFDIENFRNYRKKTNYCFQTDDLDSLGTNMIQSNSITNLNSCIDQQKINNDFVYYNKSDNKCYGFDNNTIQGIKDNLVSNDSGDIIDTDCSDKRHIYRIKGKHKYNDLEHKDFYYQFQKNNSKIRGKRYNNIKNHTNIKLDSNNPTNVQDECLKYCVNSYWKDNSNISPTLDSDNYTNYYSLQKVNSKKIKCNCGEGDATKDRLISKDDSFLYKVSNKA